MKKALVNTRLLLIVSVCLITAAGCKKNGDVVNPVLTNDDLYANAIADAMVTDSTERVDTLWPVSATNSHLQFKNINGKYYVLMATFMKYPNSYPVGDSINNTWGESWLFIPEQMKMRLSPGFTSSSDTIMRICQLLGLPPKNSNSNTHIGLLWVPGDKLVRPAGSNAITTTDATEILQPTVTADYATWFDNYIIYAYYHTLQSATDFHYPWTRLGYTYDWAPGVSEVGLSEYVLQANSPIWVEQVTTAAAFFK